MRQRRTVQTSLFDQFCSHEIGLELKAMSDWLDQQPDLVSLVANDLDSGAVKPTGRQGLPAEAVLRCALLKQYRQLSYEELAFHLEDSASFRAFARLPFGFSPKKSVLHKTIGRVRPRPSRRSTARCLPAPARPRSKTARWCGSIPPSPPRRSTRRATAAFFMMRSG